LRQSDRQQTAPASESHTRRVPCMKLSRKIILHTARIAVRHRRRRSSGLSLFCLAKWRTGTPSQYDSTSTSLVGRYPSTSDGKATEGSPEKFALNLCRLAASFLRSSWSLSIPANSSTIPGRFIQYSPLSHPKGSASTTLTANRRRSRSASMSSSTLGCSTFTATSLASPPPPPTAPSPPRGATRTQPRYTCPMHPLPKISPSSMRRRQSGPNDLAMARSVWRHEWGRARSWRAPNTEQNGCPNRSGRDPAHCMSLMTAAPLRSTHPRHIRRYHPVHRPSSPSPPPPGPPSATSCASPLPSSTGLRRLSTR
jgi:hypothetical protein